MPTIVIRATIIYIVLTLMIRVSGKRQVGQLDITDFVTTILLSEIACLPIDDPDIPLLYAITPISVIVCIEIILTFIKNKSSFLKKAFESKCCILIEKGKIVPKALEKTRISVEELLGELRLKGIPRIDEVYYAIIEHNGNISVIPKNQRQPLTPDDMGIEVTESGISHTLIVDGQVNESGLKKRQKSEEWLYGVLRKCNLRTEEIFLMSIDDSEKIYISKKDGKK
ncbi:MAG: DUF421 domain-containing protein [Clostridia bacterium]|nr:DUF421 domain-containing protein [Clostridia bacterium]